MKNSLSYSEDEEAVKDKMGLSKDRKSLKVNESLTLGGIPHPL
jgi:hypothetical protein